MQSADDKYYRSKDKSAVPGNLAVRTHAAVPESKPDRPRKKEGGAPHAVPIFGQEDVTAEPAPMHDLIVNDRDDLYSATTEVIGLLMAGKQPRVIVANDELLARLETSLDLAVGRAAITAKQRDQVLFAKVQATKKTAIAVVVPAPRADDDNEYAG